MATPLMLTIVVDAVNETDAHLSVVVGDEDDVEDVFTVGVQLPQLPVHSLQSLDGKRGPPTQTPRDLYLELVAGIQREERGGQGPGLG